jgi:hypothetical protein
MTRPSLFRCDLPDGRLHLQEGPIDIIIEAFGDRKERRHAYDAAAACFHDVLPGLVSELPELRRPVGAAVLQGPVARRMQAACLPHLVLDGKTFVTPMAAVAGSVADHVLAAMTAAAELSRAYVNDGGDIALHLTPGETLACGLVAEICDPRLNGRAMIAAETTIRGIATSGRATLGDGGRSFSLGIADAVTVFARSAAAADVAATLIANAVDLPGHSAIERRPASELDPDSDLGDRAVTVAVGELTRDEIAAALARGQAEALKMQAAGLIEAAVLFLRGEAEVVGGEGVLPRPVGERRSRMPNTGNSPSATQKLSSRDLFPGPIDLTVQSVVEVVPLRITALDQPNLPRARPLLHGLLPLDCESDFYVSLDIDEARNAVTLHETGAGPLPVFPHAAGDIVRDADVERPVLAAGEDVNIVGHCPAPMPLGPGNKCRDDISVCSGNQAVLEEG